MKTFWKGLVGAVLFTSMLVGCSPTAHIKKDESADFRQYRTYAWVETEKTGKKNRVQDLNEQKIRDAVSKELQKNAGWKESRRNPDILLSYDLLVERGTRNETQPVYSGGFSRTFYNPYRGRFFNVYYPSQFMGYDRYSVPNREGTVTITMTDPRTDKMVWQGWTTNEMDSRNFSDRDLQKSVNAIFRKFDVAKN